jgi:ArsR family transcriptional regulator
MDLNILTFEYMNNLIEKVEALKIVSHPVRITILEELSKGVKCVSDIQDFLEIRQSNISQHLSAMRHAGLIDYFIDGRLRCYFLKNPLILDLLEILRKDHPCELPGPDCCPVTKKGKYPGDRSK